jgi:photosystem II stability/assembly factor-like uncharacterized protein
LKYTISAFLILAINLSAQWTQTNGPSAGFVRSFLYNGTDIILGMGGGGIHRSSDGGSGWQQINSGLFSTDIKILQLKDSLIFAGSDEGVYMSSDGGASWEPKFNGLIDTYIKSMTICGNDLYAGTYVNGIFKSSDNGDTWARVYAPGAKYVYFLANDGTNIFAATYGNGMLFSQNGGLTWISRNSGLGSVDLLTVHSFGGTQFSSTPGTLYRTTDQGLNWSSVASAQVKDMTEKGGILYAAFLGSGVYKSVNDGQTWTSCGNTGLTEKDIWSIGTDGTYLFTGVSSGNVYRSSNNGTNWSLASAGIVKGSYCGSIEAVTSILPVDSLNNRIIAGTHGSHLYNSSNEGNTWTQKSVGTVEIRDIESAGRSVLVGTDMLGLFLSNDYGETYSEYNTGLTSKWIHSLHISNRLNGEIFAGSGEEGLFFKNSSSNWTARDTGISSGDIRDIAGNNPEMYVATGESGVFRSADYGLNWSSANSGIPTGRTSCLLLTDSLLFTGTCDAGVYVSSDKGVSWNPANNGMNDSIFVTCLKNYNSIILAGTKTDGVFISRDNGTTWKGFNSGLSNTHIASIDIFKQHIYTGTISSGVWKRPLSDLEVLGTPVNLIISTNTTSSLLSWDGVSGASYYRIYRSDDPYSGFTEIGTSVSPDFEDTNISGGNKYFYIVTADNSKCY